MALIELLEFVTRHLPFLFEGNWFRFVDSVEGGRFATLTLQSKNTRLRFECEDGPRGEAWGALLQPAVADPDDMRAWYHIGNAQQALSGERPSYRLDDPAAAFLAESLARIDRDFADETRREELLRALLAARRAR